MKRDDKWDLVTGLITTPYVWTYIGMTVKMEMRPVATEKIEDLTAPCHEMKSAPKDTTMTENRMIVATRERRFSNEVSGICAVLTKSDRPDSGQSPCIGQSHPEALNSKSFTRGVRDRATSSLSSARPTLISKSDFHHQLVLVGTSIRLKLVPVVSPVQGTSIQKSMKEFPNCLP